MLPIIFCLIVSVMPLAIGVFAAFAAWTERRAVSPKAHRLSAGDDFADGDDAVFR
jgi:hypothetical protein